MRLHPCHRGDCADFFSTTQQTECIDLDAPVSTIGEIERAAAQAGRTWNDQLTYLVELCLGDHLSDFDDRHSVDDWRTLLSRCKFRLGETECWIPFTCLWETTP